MRRIVFVGNCQASMLAEAYQKFVASYSGDQVRYIPSYEDLKDEDRSALGTADVLVQQVLDFEPKIDLTITKIGVHHHLVPFVTAAFLWPFATEAHIKNEPLPFLRDGPYPAQLGDAYLNRKIAAHIDPETAIAEYLDQDLAGIAQLDRRYELTIEKQRQRDEIAGYNLADLIDRSFRDESLFLSPAHPERRMTLELFTQFFTAIDAGKDAILRLQREMLANPFPRDEAPIHPSVCRHFGLRFITDPEEHRYRYSVEGKFTFREFALRYMRYEWNRDLAEGIALSKNGKDAEAIEKLSTALKRSQHSGYGHLHMAESFARMTRLDDAIAAAQTAVELDPACRAAGCHLLSHLFSRQGHDEDAIAAARLSADLSTSNVYHCARLGDLLKQAGDLAGAEEVFERASRLSPPNGYAFAQLGDLLAAKGKLEEGIAALRRAIEIEPNNAALHNALSHMLTRHGERQAAIIVARKAVALNPHNSHYSGHLGNLLLLVGDVDGAEAALRQAIQVPPVNAQAYAQLARLLALKENDEQALVEALGAAHRALQLEPENAAFKELLRNIQKRNALTDCAASSVIVVGNSRVHLPKGLVGGVSSDTGRIIETSQPSAKDQKVNRERKSALDDGIDFELFPQAKPALRFINSHGKIGAAI